MTASLDLHARGTLQDLIDHLEVHDVQVPGLDKWRDLRVDLLKQPEPPRPNDLLERTAEELDAWAREVAVHRVITSKPDHYANLLASFREPLDKAMLGRIKGNASAIVEQLRPTFDAAAAVMRAAVDQGVSASDNRETLFQASDEARAAWLATHSQAAILDEVFTTRQLLSTVAGVAPSFPWPLSRANSLERDHFTQGRAPSGIDWTPTVINTSQNPGISLGPYNADAPWERWIAVAPHLYLTDPAEAAG